MAKVGRAARVASRQRAEVLGNGSSAGTDKEIQAAETGELYMINHDHASALTITLPPIADGAYFRFQLMAELGAAGTIVIQKHANDAAGTVKGTILEQKLENSGVTSIAGTIKDDGNDSKLTIDDDTHVGSYVEVYCDGTNWQFSGVCIVDALGQTAFS